MKNTIYRLLYGTVTVLVKLADVRESEAIYFDPETDKLYRVFSFEISKEKEPGLLYYENDDHAELAAIAWHEEQIHILKLHLKAKNK